MIYDKYIGLPYLANGRTEAGVDCWGLVRLFYRDELNIDLPSYTDNYEGPNDPSIISLMDEYKDVNWKKQTIPEVGDVCVFNIYGEPCHVGIYVGEGKFMHSRENRDVVIESLDNPKWSKRIEGTYKPDSNKQIQVVGAPHPLKTSIYRDWTVAGTTVRDFVNFTKEKYKVSDKLSSKLRVVIDGKDVPMEKWDTTILQQGQTIAYRSIPEGKDTLRLILTIAVVYMAIQFGPEFGQALGMTTEGATVAGYTEAGVATTAGRIVGTMAINMAGMALINAVFPIRPPVDPGQARQLNMFTGASNQVNKFGAIPVVLGTLRVTGLMGATPYIETTPDSSVLSLLIVWGFGPLVIDDASICVGLTPLTQFYPSNYPSTAPKFHTMTGFAGEDAAELNRIYPQSIEQKIMQVELKNNSIDGNNWAEYRFLKKAESLDVGLMFPEGMREVTDTGKINEAMAGVEIQVAKYNPITNIINEADWSPVDGYSVGYWASVTRDIRFYQYALDSIRSYTNINGEEINLYQYATFAMRPGGGIQVYMGAATDNINSDPSATLLSKYRSGSFLGLVGDNSSYSKTPNVPNGDIKLYTICTYAGDVVSTVRDIDNAPYHLGLELTLEPFTTAVTDNDGFTTNVNTGKLNVIIGAGKIYVQGGNYPLPGVTKTIFTSLEFTGVDKADTARHWCNFLYTYGIWQGGTGNLNINLSKVVTFEYTGYYNFETSADDYGILYLDGAEILNIPGYSEVVSGLVYVDAGQHTIQLTATNTGGGAGAACRITYTSNSGMNALNAQNTGVQLYFGSGGFLTKRKDAFNFNYRVNSLPHAYYAIRVRRINDDTAEPTTSARRYFKAILFDVTAYSTQDDAGNLLTPTINPPGCYIAKTAIRVQSTNKVNGSIDGVNAMVQTVAPIWDTTLKTWNFANKSQGTSNPASLFIYVLMHSANAYRIEDADKYSSLDLTTLGSWYDFCNADNVNSIVFTYNDIITGTKSVMEVLRDIAAAGMASPAFIDGKWSVIIDRPRAYTTQYFTTHNSWGFESTKLLPKIPDAFRITFPNEAKAYQPDEIFVYNYGKTKDNAKLFESISLPGVTNRTQAVFFGKWHLAQLKLRPEVYTLNTDFEYLVCTRGDLVKVTHDVPRWGTSSGRISSISNTTTLKLSESVYLEVGKQYTILIRTNNVDSATKALQSVTKTLTTITTSTMYDQITITTPIVSGDNVETDNLYMLGEVGKETQQLIVTSIEPMSNISAKLTLVDYAPSIYTADPTSTLLVSDANITGENTPLIKNSIQGYPTITGTTSDSTASQLISTGIYQNVLIVAYTHPASLSNNAERIQIQIVSSDMEFIDNSPTGNTIVSKDTSSTTITSLATTSMYKIRARYTNSSSSIVGPWSSTFNTRNAGKDTNLYTPTSLTVSLQGIALIATALSSFIPNDFNTYEYRFIQNNTATSDFWDLDITSNNIKVVQSRTTGRLDITNFPTPRVSEAGITYRVACRAIDNNNNYSTTSLLSSITIKTIV